MRKIIDVFKNRNFLNVLFNQFFVGLNSNLFRPFLLTLFFYFGIRNFSNENIVVVMGVFFIPFFIFSGIIGDIVDKFQKAKLIKIIKGFEILTSLIASFSLINGNVKILYLAMFMYGINAAFTLTLTSGILPEIVKEKEYIITNGIMKFFLVFGVLFSIVFTKFIDINVYEASIILVLISVLGFISSLFIENSSNQEMATKIEFNFIKSAILNTKKIKHSESIFLMILGVSWFWLVFTVLLFKMPFLVDKIIIGNENVLVLLASLFLCGIGIGAVLCQFILKDEISAKYVPITIIIMTVFLFDFAFVSFGYIPNVTSIDLLNPIKGIAPTNVFEFVNSFSGLRIGFDLFMIGILGGIYVVPLKSLLQKDTNIKDLGKVMAVNNMINVLFIVMGGALSYVLAMFNFSVPFLFMMIAGLSLVVAFYICLILPSALFKMLARNVLRLVYKVELNGIENYKNANKKSLIIANHQSFLDPILLGAFLPGRPVFAINTFIAENPFLKPLLKLVDVVPIDPTNPMATKALVNAVEAGKSVVIFPEGRITTTGALMKIYDGVGLVADATNADIIPVRISGAELSIFSGFRKHLNFNPSSRIKITILPTRKITIDPNIQDKKRRQIAKEIISTIMNEMMFETSKFEVDIFKSLLNARSIYGASYKILEDISRRVMTYDDLVKESMIYGKMMAKQCKGEDNVGIMLSNLNITLTLFMGLHYVGKVPAMINFSSGVYNILSMVKTAKINTVYTSSQFVEMMKLENVVKALEENGVKVRYAEDLKASIGLDDVVINYFRNKFISILYKEIDCNEPAVILFTSGSEGNPKGVVLSHKNLKANHLQMLSVFPINSRDVVFNVLPMFHSFGLNSGVLMPVLSGTKTVLYPSPLNYRAIPELIYDTNATMMFGTDTFLSGYAKVADPYDFYSMRYIIAGAEKIREETKRTYSDRFGVRIYEGYGTTEASPIVTMNTPFNCKFGTVGKFLPRIEYKLEKVEGVDEGGRLFIKGPNLMKGYLKSEKAGVIESLLDNWYDTGDIVFVDEEGFASIKGRLKRFAKLGGEMVALDTVESNIRKLYPDFKSAVESIPSDKKGEQILLVTTNKNANLSEIRDFYKTNGLPEIAIPKIIECVDEIPTLGSGKTNYRKIKEMFIKGE